MDNYKVIKLQNHEAHKWLLEKHYARRLCSMSYVYGVTNSDKILGVCTFGFPPNNSYNDGKCLFHTKKVKTLELNRLVLNSGQNKNLLSYFVSQCLKQLPKPCAIISYADPNQNHYGYIYQATNWMYLGESTPKHRYYFENGETFDIRRGIHNKGKIIKKERIKSTLRYLYLIGSKKEKKEMLKDLKVSQKPYPKGMSKKYECDDLNILYQKTLFDCT